MSIQSQASKGGLCDGPSPQFRNILFLTDFSLCSDSALPYVRAIADRYGATVHVVHVVRKERMIGPLHIPHGDVQAESQAARLAMDNLARSDAFKGVLCTQFVERGEVLEAVCKLVSRLRTDLIILGTHGRRGLKYVVLGSLAEQLFRHAACPVLTVGPQVHNRGVAQGRIDRILYATDLSPASLRALDYGLYIARTSYAELILLHAIFYLGESPLFDLDESVREARRRLTDLVVKSGVDYQVVVESGRPPDVILTTAEESKADLVIMGAHHAGVASAHAPWAIAHEVVCGTPCPALMVPG
jgi:nucleotide-binding universal stress UspA family protein